MTKPQPQTAAHSTWQAPMQQKPPVQPTTESATHTVAYASANWTNANQSIVQAKRYSQRAQPRNQTAQPHNWVPRQQVIQRLPTRETRYRPIPDKEYFQFYVTGATDKVTYKSVAGTSHGAFRTENQMTKPQPQTAAHSRWQAPMQQKPPVQPTTESATHTVAYASANWTNANQSIVQAKRYSQRAQPRNQTAQPHNWVPRQQVIQRLPTRETRYRPIPDKEYFQFYVTGATDKATHTVAYASANWTNANQSIVQAKRYSQRAQPRNQTAQPHNWVPRQQVIQRLPTRETRYRPIPDKEYFQFYVTGATDKDLSSCIEGLNQLQPCSDVNIGGQSAMNVYNARVETRSGVSFNIGQAQNVRGETCDSTDSGLAGIPPSSHNNEFKKEHNDSMMTQSQVDTFSRIMGSVGVIFSPWIFGTAFRVGSKYLITAYHVIRDIINVDRRSVASMSVHFNENIKPSPHTYRLHNEFYFDEQLDIAILTIDNHPDVNLPDPLHLSSGIIEGNIANLSLIGYGNPDCEAKKHLDYCCQVIPQHSAVISEAHSFLQQHSTSLKQALPANCYLVDLGYKGYDASHNVIINCYSEKGASGGPLIDCRNPDFPQVVGVLTHGLPACFWELRKDDQLKFPKKYRLEVGTRMTDIKEFINKIDQQLNTQFSKDWFPNDDRDRPKVVKSWY